MATKRLKIPPKRSKEFKEFKAAIAWYRIAAKKWPENFVGEVDVAGELPLDSPQAGPCSIFQLGGLGCDGFPSPLSTMRETRSFNFWP